jgi:tRNA A37 threonylcarbamoyltransferase TsaD
MGIMAKERNGRVCAMDQRYCIDNGAMIAQAGVLQFQHGETTALKDATCTQRCCLMIALYLALDSDNYVVRVQVPHG